MGGWRELTNAVDLPAGGDPLGHVLDHAVLNLAVAAVIEVVVVEVEHGRGVGLTGCGISDADKVLAEHAGPDRVAERAVLVEDLVADVLLVGPLVDESAFGWGKRGFG